MKSLKIIVFTLALLTLGTNSFGQNITAGIAKAVITCTSASSELQVEFDKSLLSLLEEARKAYEKAPDNAKPAAKANLEKLFKNIKKLGDTSAVPGMNIIRLDTVAIVPDGGAGTPVMFRYSIKGITDPTTGLGQIRLNVFDRPTAGDELPDVLRFDVNGLVKSNDDLGLVIQGVTKNPSMAVISVDPSCKPLATGLPVQTQDKDGLVPDRRFIEKFDSDVSKEDGNFLLDLSLDGTKRSKTVRKNAFATIGLTIVPKHFTKLGFHGIYEFQPFFLELNYKAATDKTTFTTLMGTRLNHLYVFGDDGRGYSNKEDKRQLVPGIATTITGKFEVERFFKATNLVGEFQSGIPFNIMQSRAWKLRIEPSIGMAAGRNLNQPDDAARAFTILSGNAASRWIARPFVNGELVFEGWRDRFIKPTVTIGYRRSFPLFAEGYLDSKGKVVAGYSRIVRDYVTAKLSFDAGKLLTPFFSYERGRQSPGYVLVDSKFRLGIGVKFKGKDR